MDWLRLRSGLGRGGLFVVFGFSVDGLRVCVSRLIMVSLGGRGVMRVGMGFGFGFGGGGMIVMRLVRLVRRFRRRVVAGGRFDRGMGGVVVLVFFAHSQIPLPLCAVFGAKSV